MGRSALPEASGTGRNWRRKTYNQSTVGVFGVLESVAPDVGLCEFLVAGIGENRDVVGGGVHEPGPHHCVRHSSARWRGGPARAANPGVLAGKTPTVDFMVIGGLLA